MNPDLECRGFRCWAGGLSTIGLAELDGCASLQTRVDRKYLIARTDLDALTVPLEAMAKVLEIGGRRHFGYWSTYYDTADLGSFQDAARKRPRRFKVRARTYLDGGATYLEVKTRSARGQTVKSRIPALVTAHEQLEPEEHHFIADTLDRRISRRPPSAASQVELERMILRLRPTMSTEYQRTTFLVADRSRLTIDHALCVSDVDGRSRHLIEHVVVETKSSRRPSLVDRLLWDAGHRPVTFSKFGTGLALLHPELPASKWNRVLRQQLDWSPLEAAVPAAIDPSVR